MLEMETKTTEKQIVNAVLEEYSDPTQRSLYKNQEGGTCLYLSDNGNKCGVGRFMTDEALAICGKSSKKISTLSLKYGLDNLMQEKYKGFSVLFWKKIQTLHDTDHFWSEDGVTEDGLAYAKREFKCRN